MRPGLAETINELKTKGYREDFNLYRAIAGHRFSDDFKIDDIYRFDEQTDPADQSILYAISSKVGDRKGILVNGFGTFTEADVDEMVELLRRRKMP